MLSIMHQHPMINQRGSSKLRHWGINHSLGGQQTLASASEANDRGCLKL